MSLIGKFRENLLKYDKNGSTSFPTFIQEQRVVAFEEFLIESEESSFKDFYNQFELKVQDEIDFLMEKIVQSHIEENKKSLVEKIVHSSITTQIQGLSEFQQLDDEISKWIQNQLKVENLLLKLEFYIPELSDCLLQ